MGSGTFNHPFSCSSFHKSTRCTTESLTWPCPHRTESKTKGLSQIHLNMNPKQKHVGRFPSFLNISLLQLLREALFPTFPTSSHSPQCLKENTHIWSMMFLGFSVLTPLFWRVAWILSTWNTIFLFWRHNSSLMAIHNRTCGASLEISEAFSPGSSWDDLAAGDWILKEVESNLNYHLHIWTHISCIYIYKYIDMSIYRCSKFGYRKSREKFDQHHHHHQQSVTVSRLWFATCQLPTPKPKWCHFQPKFLPATFGEVCRPLDAHWKLPGWITLVTVPNQ